MSAELRGLTVHIATDRWRETVVDSVDLVVPDGRITALLGASGCGKSMVAAALAGRLPASAQRTGEIRLADVPVRDRRPAAGDVVGFLPQDGVRAFDPDETVGRQLRARERRYGAWSLDRACAAAHYPHDAFDLLPAQHSGGQIQRAALAAALLPAPGVLVVDEPTASLERDTAYPVWKTLRAYADAGAAVLAITHDVALLLATAFADDMVVMRDGRTVVSGCPAQLLGNTDPYVRGLFRPVCPP